MLRTFLKIAFCAGMLLEAHPATCAAFYSQPLEVSEVPIGNLLAWQTVTEIEVASFVIEKSIDGQNFFELGSVTGAGFSMIDNAYHYLDLAASEVKNYYRLREIGNDGTTFYSFPVLFEKKLANLIQVVGMSSPDVNKTFKMTVEVKNAMVIECMVTNFSGKPLQRFQLNAEFGLNALTVDMETFPSGLYQLKLKHGEEVESIVLRKIEDPNTPRVPVATTKKSSVSRQK